MEKITLTLTKSEWQELTTFVLLECGAAISIQDKYRRAIVLNTLKQMYIKLHNKLHSLKEKNKLNLTFPEASVLAIQMGANWSGYLSISLIGIIDQKLT